MGRRFEPDGAYVISVADIHATGDYFSHEDLWIRSLRNPSLEYRNGYFLFDTGRWRGIEWTDIRESDLSAKTLVIGHCDNDVTGAMVSEIFSASRPRAIYATNTTKEANSIGNVRMLPLGIPNDERHSKTHIVQSDTSLLRKAWKAGRPPSLSADLALYANFSVRNNPTVRRAALEVLEKVPDARLGSFVLSKRGRLADMVAMRQSGLAVCPRGAGMDTHRFWECLLVGSTPIVLDSDHCAHLAEELKLPAITIPSWESLSDREYLIQQWEDIQDQEWDFAPLTSEYWISEVEASLTV